MESPKVAGFGGVGKAFSTAMALMRLVEDGVDVIRAILNTWSEERIESLAASDYA
jgi:CubicO group peptidase (beta-lactamase class C family)